MSKIVNIIKAFLGLIIFFGVQLLTVTLFNNILTNGGLVIRNLIYCGMELVTLGLLIIIHFDKLKEDFLDFDKNYEKYLKLAFRVYLIGLVVMVISNLIINKYILVDNIAYNEQADRLVIFKYPFYSVLGIIVTGPFIEEMVFRLGFKRYFKSKIVYYVVSCILFAGVHVLNGISNPLELLYFIPYGSFAVAFAYILDKTNNIFSSTIIHTFHNTFSVLIIVSLGLIGV